MCDKYFNVYATNAYKQVLDFYDGKFAQRSGFPYIKHINEGILVLRQIKASPEAQQAFCLHPLFQTDENLMENINRLESIVNGNCYLLSLTMEYRSVANEYLSPCGIINPEKIRLSPIKDVNDMLIADKVQNRKDFELNRDKYDNANILDGYFKNWLTKLGISEKHYQKLIAKIS